MKLAAERLKTINEWADFWRYDIGVNVIPANTRKKKPMNPGRNGRIIQFLKNCMMNGKRLELLTMASLLFLVKCITIHKKKACILSVLTVIMEKQSKRSLHGWTNISLSQLAQWTLVEEHNDDLTKAHVLLYSHKPFPKKSSNNNGHLNPKLNANEVPAIEVKGLGSHGILFVTPSIHKNGQPYQIIGTHDPVIVDDFVTSHR